MQISRPVQTATELGAILKKARIDADLRQRDAADLCGVSERFLIELEQGKPGARLELVLNVCRGLGVALEVRAPGPTESGMPKRRKARMRSLRAAT